MEKTEKSVIAIFAIMALLSGISFVPTLKANATESQEAEQVQGTQNNDNHNNEIEKQEAEEADQEESDLHKHVDSIKSVKDNITLPEVDADKIATYQDAVNALKSFQEALNQIKSASEVQAKLGVSLNDKEKALLEKLLAKYNGDFGNLDARIAELNGQIQNLIDLLTPLANQPISGYLGLRKLLMEEIKDFREQIEKLAELRDIDIDEIDEEVS